MTDRTPRFLRLARTLALAGGAVTVSCAAAVAPNDGETPADALASVDARDGSNLTCPAMVPSGGTCTVGQHCAYNTRCYDAPYVVECQCVGDGSTTGQWQCGLCEGPLPPPEIA